MRYLTIYVRQEYKKNNLAGVLGKKPEHIHIVIQEISEENWGCSGLLTDEWKKQQV